MSKVKDLYKYAQSNNKKLLFDNISGITYPVIEGNTSNFITDYTNNYEELDRMFYNRYSSMKPILPDDEDKALYFADWSASLKSILYFYLESWARLYYALSLEYNPTWNYDGQNTTRTQGKTEGLSGTDTVVYDRDAHVKTEVRGQRNATDTNYEVAFDNTREKEVGKTASQDDSYTDTFTDQANEDEDRTTYGKQNNVDYTVTETKGGNQGTTTTQQMLQEEFELRKRSFWNNVFMAIVKEMLFF